MRASRVALCAPVPQRATMYGFPTHELLNQYNAACARMGQRPYGTAITPETVEEERVPHRVVLPNKDLNPASMNSWRKHDLLPKENRNNPDSFHYEHYRHGGKAFQQVFLEDMQRLSRFPEPGVLVVDVRSDYSLVKQHVPFSVRLPMEEVFYALQLPDPAFRQMYGVDKPRAGTEIVCVSHNGVAAEKALKAFERWGHAAECLFNFRGGTNELFGEAHDDMGSATEVVDVEEAPRAYPVRSPEYLARVGPFAEKYSPYPPEELEELRRRDEEGTWEVKKRADPTQPIGKHAKRTQAYYETLDGKFVKDRLKPEVLWYDHSHREPWFRWRDPDLTLDRAFRPGTPLTAQFWRHVPQ